MSSSTSTSAAIHDILSRDRPLDHEFWALVDALPKPINVNDPETKSALDLYIIAQSICDVLRGVEILRGMHYRGFFSHEFCLDEINRDNVQEWVKMCVAGNFQRLGDVLRCAMNQSENKRSWVANES
jgi:hypothetical protein